MYRFWWKNTENAIIFVSGPIRMGLVISIIYFIFYFQFIYCGSWVKSHAFQLNNTPLGIAVTYSQTDGKINKPVFDGDSPSHQFTNDIKFTFLYL